MNYNALVSKFRELARDFLRLKMVNRVRDFILELDKSIAYETKQKECATKGIARCNYALSKLDPEDPDFDSLKEANERDIEGYNADIKVYDEKVTNLNKKIADYNKEIDAISKGETKVDASELSAKAEKLANHYIKGQAIEVVIEE